MDILRNSKITYPVKSIAFLTLSRQKLLKNAVQP